MRANPSKGCFSKCLFALHRPGSERSWAGRVPSPWRRTLLWKFSFGLNNPCCCSSGSFPLPFILASLLPKPVQAKAARRSSAWDSHPTGCVQLKKTNAGLHRGQGLCGRRPQEVAEDPAEGRLLELVTWAGATRRHGGDSFVLYNV